VGDARLSGLAVQKAVQNSLSSRLVSAEFSPSYRLLRKDGFNHVVCKKAFVYKGFKVFYVCNDKPNARLGIIASKRIFPRAIQRNHIKRVVREVFRQHSIKAEQIDLVVMARRSDANVLHHNDLKELFNRVVN